MPGLDVQPLVLGKASQFVARGDVPPVLYNVDGELGGRWRSGSDTRFGGTDDSGANGHSPAGQDTQYTGPHHHDVRPVCDLLSWRDDVAKRPGSDARIPRDVRRSDVSDLGSGPSGGRCRDGRENQSAEGMTP